MLACCLSPSPTPRTRHSQPQQEPAPPQQQQALPPAAASLTDRRHPRFIIAKSPSTRRPHHLLSLQMEKRSLADELYSNILEPKADIVIDKKQSQSLDVEDEQWCEDEKFDPSSDLNREWQRRKNQFHAIGYRDGLIAGKEASAQEGFNIGFKESVVEGFNWGLIRGVTGALECLPVELREKMIESDETRNKFHNLYECVNKLSTTDAVKMFEDGGVLDSYYEQLQSLIVDSPAIKVELRDKSVD